MGESVAIIILSKDKDQVLLIKRRDIPVWVLPGGGIEKGETPELAALREGEEETGYCLEIIRKVAKYSPLNRLTHPTHFFELKIIAGEPQTGTETKEIAFFPTHNLPKKIPPFYIDWIHDALLQNKELIIKPIYGTSYWQLVKFLFLHPTLTVRFLLTKCGLHYNS